MRVDRERAAAFYKMVLRHQRESGCNCKKSRQAAMGLPDAFRHCCEDKHLEDFVRAARQDGVSMEDLIGMLLQLRQEIDAERR